MFKALKIWWLQRQLKTAYWRATRWQDYMDCGYELAVHIQPRIKVWEREADEILDKLAELDPSTPTFRFREVD